MNDSNYTELITLNQKRLYQFIFTMVGNQANAWDILQEVNLILLRKESDFTPGTNFKAWSNTIARFHTLNFIRKNQRGIVDFLTPEIAENLANELEARNASETGHDTDTKAALERCRSKLTSKSQRLLQLFYERNLSIKDIIPLIGMKESAVKQALRRSRLTLQECIETQLRITS